MKFLAGIKISKARWMTRRRPRSRRLNACATGLKGGAQLTGGITQDEIARLQSVEAYLLRFY